MLKFFSSQAKGLTQCPCWSLSSKEEWLFIQCQTSCVYWLEHRNINIIIFYVLWFDLLSISFLLQKIAFSCLVQLKKPLVLCLYFKLASDALQENQYWHVSRLNGELAKLDQCVCVACRLITEQTMRNMYNSLCWCVIYVVLKFFYECKAWKESISSPHVPFKRRGRKPPLCLPVIPKNLWTILLRNISK